MKNTLLVLLISLFTLSFFSCEDKEEDSLSLSAGSFDFDSEGGTGTIEILTNRDWYISSATDWLTFVPTNGSGNSAFVVNALLNNEDQDRTSTFYIHAGKLSDTVRINQQGTYLSLDRKEVLFDRDGTPQTISLITNYAWEINPGSEGLKWCTVEPAEGTGSQILLLTPIVYQEREPRKQHKIEFLCNGASYILLISQEIDNTAPSAPVLISPDGTDEDGLYPYFTWEPSVDEDGDDIFYHVLVSEDDTLPVEEWLDISGRISETDFLVTRKILKENTFYYWQVLASDDFQGESYSDIFSFTTGRNIIYKNDSVFVLQESKMIYPQLPNLVILGDGFIEEDFGRGNIFDLMTETAVDAFFSLQPLASFRDYFNVYKIITYSEESGATVNKDFVDYDVQAQTRKTVFSSSLEGGSSTTIRCNTDTVFTYVQKQLSLTEEELDNTTIILMINLDVYAGSTALSFTGRSVSMCPGGRLTFPEVVCHEAAGHGFGRLADEYVRYPNLFIEEKYINDIVNFRGENIWNYAANISLTNNPAEIHWCHYLGRSGYDVGFYEGGYFFGKGVWRPEEYSCMEDNVPYFNAPSRESIVRRLMGIIGEEFNIEQFMAEDNPKSYADLLSRSSVIRKPSLGVPVLLK